MKWREEFKLNKSSSSPGAAGAEAISRKHIMDRPIKGGLIAYLFLSRTLFSIAFSRRHYGQWSKPLYVYTPHSILSISTFCQPMDRFQGRLCLASNINAWFKTSLDFHFHSHAF